MKVYIYHWMNSWDSMNSISSRIQIYFNNSTVQIIQLQKI